jgi:hypothetical protein
MVEPKEFDFLERSLKDEKECNIQTKEVQKWLSNQILNRSKYVNQIEGLDNLDHTQKFLEGLNVLDIEAIDEGDYLGIVAFGPIDIPPGLLQSQPGKQGSHYTATKWAEIADPVNYAIKDIKGFDIHKEMGKVRRGLKKLQSKAKLNYKDWEKGDKTPLKSFILLDESEFPRNLVLVFPIEFKENSKMHRLMVKARELQPGRFEQIIQKIISSI